jgi:hypothetical protein
MKINQSQKLEIARSHVDERQLPRQLPDRELLREAHDRDVLRQGVLVQVPGRPRKADQALHRVSELLADRRQVGGEPDQRQECRARHSFQLIRML